MSEEENFDGAAKDSDIEEEKVDQKQYERPRTAKDRKLRKINHEIHAELKKEGRARSGPPQASLKLEYVFGYRGYDCRNNIHFTKSGEVLYHVAAVAISQNPETGRQRFYVGHTDDILSLGLHPDRTIAATGQVGKQATIHLWNTKTMELVGVLKGHHTAGVCALAFSNDGRKLASVGLDENHSVVVWDWSKGEAIAETRGHKDKVFAVTFDPNNDERLVIVGMKHIKFLTRKGKGYSGTRGVFGNVGAPETMLCVQFGDEPGSCFTGAGNGQIYCWQDTKLRRVVAAHQGPCFALVKNGTSFLSAGKDAKIIEWNATIDTQKATHTLHGDAIKSGQLAQDTSVIRSIGVSDNGSIAAGTKSGELVFLNKADNSWKMLNQGHCQGELWGLATHPSQPECITISDDTYIRVWTTNSANGALKAMKKLDKPGRSVAYSPDGNKVAVGFTDGSFTLLKAEDLTGKKIIQDRKEQILDIKFSPDGKYLAVASNDNFVDIYEAKTEKKVGVCKGSSSYITHIDWSVQGDLLQTNSGAKEQLFYEMPSGNRKIISPAEAERDFEWATWTGVLGENVQGAWPPNSDITDINTTCRHPDKPYLATGDDFGFVKLFNFPCKDKYAKFKSYLGHSAHVTNVRWSHDGQRLYSVGGADTSLMIWSLEGSGSGKSDASDSGDSDPE